MAWRPRWSQSGGCSNAAIARRYSFGSTNIRRPAKCARVRRRGALFPPHDAEREQTLHQLHQSPRLWGLPRSRWTLSLLSQLCQSVQGLSDSGVWRRLRRWKIALRRTRQYITSPDEAYRQKVALLHRAQQQALCGELVLLYGDEHTFYRQPLAGALWHQRGGAGKTQPRCVRSHKSDTKRRTIAAMNAQTGQVHWLGCSKSRLKELCQFLKQLRAAHGEQKVVLVWDNWPVHLHERVLRCASEQRIELLWLPTYSPWLNPIEKLWRWLKHDILVAHRHSSEWLVLREKVEQFLEQFQQPSPQLLRYCGLLAD